ncbi:hypothetical protein FVE85_7051 [Porphyridium purpureum]|uniref:Uncharacterized protein n=1 Tax=Porphyridium purpureum TaxID=35688 RepID=A0A5J4Z6W5_PORPP|nr:hypothetical protein FVE85_7051 [Porphyridium purpureum]|eukprot:POR5935..scf295_1
MNRMEFDAGHAGIVQSRVKMFECGAEANELESVVLLHTNFDFLKPLTGVYVAQGAPDPQSSESFKPVILVQGDWAKQLALTLTGTVTGGISGACIGALLVSGTCAILFGVQGEKLGEIALSGAQLGALGGAVLGAYKGLHARSFRDAVVDGVKSGFVAGAIAAAMLLLHESVKIARDMIRNGYSYAKGDLLDAMDDQLNKLEKWYQKQLEELKHQCKEMTDDAIRRGGSEGERLMKLANDIYQKNLKELEEKAIEKGGHLQKLLQGCLAEIDAIAATNIAKGEAAGHRIVDNAAKVAGELIAEGEDAGGRVINEASKQGAKLPGSMWVNVRDGFTRELRKLFK